MVVTVGLVSLCLLCWMAHGATNDETAAAVCHNEHHHPHFRTSSSSSSSSTRSLDVESRDDASDRRRLCRNHHHQHFPYCYNNDTTGPSSSLNDDDDEDDPTITAPLHPSTAADDGDDDDDEVVEFPLPVDDDPSVWWSFERDVRGLHHHGVVESNRGIFVGRCAVDDDPRNHWPDYAYNTGPPPPPPRSAVRLPGEFEATAANATTLYVAWSPVWIGFQTFYTDLLRAAQDHVAHVVVLVQESTTQTEFEEWIARLVEAGVNVNSNDNGKFRFQDAVLNSNWIRDYGPVFVQNDERGETSIIDMRYLADRLDDDVVPTRMGGWWSLPVYRLPLELEGGNLISDGAGNCLTSDLTAEKNERNGYDEDLLKETLREYFGCQQTLILPRLKGEKTGHVDMYATFAGPKKVILGQYSNEDDPENARTLTYANALLLQFNYKVRRIPMPGNRDGVYRSYTNSLVVGGVVLFPIYRDDTRYEVEAMRVFELAYPDRRVVPIDTTDMIYSMGGIHCATLTANLGLNGR